MYDKELLIIILAQIKEAVEKIQSRFSTIISVYDFTDSPQGMEKLDSICMLFIAIGESLKQIDKLTDNELLKKYAEIDWKGIKGFRDIISHHYFDIDAEEVFWGCKNEIPKLLIVMNKIIEDLRIKK